MLLLTSKVSDGSDTGHGRAREDPAHGSIRVIGLYLIKLFLKTNRIVLSIVSLKFSI